MDYERLPEPSVSVLSFGDNNGVVSVVCCLLSALLSAVSCLLYVVCCLLSYV